MAEVNVTKDELTSSIAQYKNQAQVIDAQLQQIEQQKSVALRLREQLSGAVQALEQLVKNVEAREKQADDEKKASEVSSAANQKAINDLLDAATPAPTTEAVAEPVTA